LIPRPIPSLWQPAIPPWATAVRSTGNGNYGKLTNLNTSQVTESIDRHRQDQMGLSGTPADAWDYDGVNELVLTD